MFFYWKLFAVIQLLYMCMNCGSSWWLDVNITSPPYITNPRSYDLVLLVKGDKVEYACQAEGNPRPEFKWLWNDQPILNSSSLMTSDPETGLLRIPSFSDREEGYFQCFASNPFGISMSSKIEIRLKIKSVSSNHTVDTVDVKDGYGAILPCKHDKDVKIPLVYQWYRRLTKGQQNTNQIQEPNRFSIDQNGTLYILKTTAEDQTTDWTFSCSFYDNQRDISFLHDVRVKVQMSDNPRPPPQLMGYTGYMSANIGQDALLECIFSGNPIPNVTWTDNRNNAIINKDRFTIFEYGRKLKIQKVNENDEGTYQCHKESLQQQLYLNVTSPPIFEKTLKRSIAPKYSSVTFNCLARPAINEEKLSPPVWFINGQPIANVSLTTRYTLNDAKTELTFYSVTEADRRCLQCKYTNSQGSLTGDAYLNIIDPLQILHQPDHVMKINFNSSVAMYIQASADSCCPLHFSWSQNGRQLLESVLHKPPYRYETGSNSVNLSIDFTGLSSDEANQLLGEYQCDVWHRVYEANRTVEVLLKWSEAAVPEQQVEVTASSNLWWIAILGGILLLIGAIFLIAFMIRNNYPRQDYLLEKEELKHKLDREKDILDQSFTEI